MHFMGIINFQNVTKSYGGEVVLENISFEIFRDERVAFIGRNGTGKTTIFNIINNEIDLDSGNVSVQPGFETAYLRQIHDEETGTTAEDVVKKAFADIEKVEALMQKAFVKMEKNPKDENLIGEYGRLHDKYEFMGGYDTDEKYSKIVQGLGIPDKLLSTEFNLLSGGERTTVMLAKALLSGPDILLLDEPTNHLDMDARKWLENYIQNYIGTVLYISHDRYFIDRTADRIIELTNKKAFLYKGNFSSYKKQKQEQQERDLKLYERQEREIKRLSETALKMRNYSTEKTINVAKNIEKRIEQINRIEKPITEETLHLSISEMGKSGREVIKAEKIYKSYGDKVLLKDVDFLIRSGERIAVIGPNGAGKSTLIKIITGELEPDSGNAKIGRSVKYAYLEQDVEFSREENTLLDEVCEQLDVTMSSARNLLGKYNFKGDDVFKKINVLSGGERSRLRLLLEMQEDVNLLILDEPTNHLDIPSREELESAIEEFGGCMIFISHDRHFINLFADRIFEIRNSTFNEYQGDYDDYILRLEKEEPTKKVPFKKKKKPDRGREKRKLDFTIRKTEQEINLLENQLEELEIQIQEHATDYEKLSQLAVKRDQVKEKLEKLYKKWMEITYV